MSNFPKETSLPKFYSTTALIAFIYAGFTILFLVYKQFFYVNGTWFHGLTVNGLALLNTLVWMGILIVFKLFLNRILKYKKADSLINVSLVFLLIGLYTVTLVVFKSVQLYLSLDGEQDINSLTSFASTSFSSAVLLILSNIALIIVTILLGIRILKIDIILNKLFSILGFSLILLGVFSALSVVNITGSEILTFLVKAFTAAVLGYILKEASQVNYADLPVSQEPEKRNDLNYSKANSQTVISSQKVAEKTEKINVLKRSKEAVPAPEVIPNLDINELEDKEMVISYFENLSKEELSRLEAVVAKKYTQSLSEDQIKNLVIQHIVEKKSYDHNRFAPK
ncbi:hypothetical protein RB619_01035 [Flavobacterium sp. LHD-80]|uniref:hypothetical protein n=1 Tax=Flavobacterium sp. LHD-80 TaxID=3071411 RepID=UPI0027DFB19F|nr:hypothetical protein [Flavobacterium sp. LHD-80]MDQ6469206.1 hypothetical protein [Flavobacterium sp. LHD-80]